MSQLSALSRNGVRIRLSDERWQHIIQEHAELSGLRQKVLETITDAERVLGGTRGEFLATRIIESGKALVVIYRETHGADGFVITAFLTRRLSSLDRRIQIWPPPT
jgi:hypothetical protein